MTDHHPQVSRILQKLPRARAADRAREVFGAEQHQYTVGPVVTADEIDRFERLHDIALPNAYKAFLLGVGNGGNGFSNSAAGPFYGIYPLGIGTPDAPVEPSQSTLAKPCLVSPRMPRDVWDALIDRLGLNADGMADDAWDAAEAALFGGLLPIGSQGCTYEHCLVLNGPHAGRVVNVDTDYTGPPVFAHEPDFLSWYERWLDEVIAGDLRQSPSWFGYRMGGTEAQLLARFRGAADDTEAQEALDGLLTKPRISGPILLELQQHHHASSEAHRTTLCQIVCKSDPLLAKPLLSDLALRDRLAFFQTLYWYAKDHLAEWEPSILSLGTGIEDEETSRFFSYLEKRLAELGSSRAGLPGPR